MTHNSNKQGQITLSSSSISSSAVARRYSISSILPPVYQWRKTLRRSRLVSCWPTLDHFLDGGGVAEEGDGHLEAIGGMAQSEDLMLKGTTQRSIVSLLAC